MGAENSTVRIALIAAALSAACGGGSGTPVGPSPPAAPASEYTSPHFTFRHTPLDAGTIAATAAAVEAEYGRITADLGVAQTRRIVVWLHADRGSLQDAVRPFVGAIPAFASGLVTGADAIHILSPNLASAWPYAAGVTGIVHEFAHCVSMHVNPLIPNNPRWLWESVALYEAAQPVDWRTVPAMSSAAPPAIEQLDAFDDTLIYQVGYSIGAFIVERWGREGLAALVRANGDTTAVLGLPEDEFVRQWFAFARR